MFPHEGLNREEYEKKMLEVILMYEADYLVLAKYMRVLTPGFVEKYKSTRSSTSTTAYQHLLALNHTKEACMSRYAKSLVQRRTSWQTISMKA